MPVRKLLICFALLVLFLGASIDVDVNLARASDGGPQGADKNSSSRMASRHPTGDNKRQLRRLSWPTSDRRHRSSIGRQSRAVERAGILEDRIRRATHDAAVTRRLDRATDCRYPGLVEDAALIRKALTNKEPRYRNVSRYDEDRSGTRRHLGLPSLSSGSKICREAISARNRRMCVNFIHERRTSCTATTQEL